LTGGRPWAALACGLALAGLSATAALAAGLLLSLSVALYLPVVLAFAIPLATLVAAAVGWGGQSLGVWLTVAAWGAASLAVGPAEAVFVALLCAAGNVLAAAVRGQWTFGRTVAVLAFLFVATAGAHSLVHRDEWGALARSALSYTAVTVEHNATTVDDADAELQLKAFSQSLRDMQANWSSLGFGICAALLIMAAVALTALTAVWMRYIAGRAAFRSSFRELRPPDALVWLAILCVALVFADWRWNLPAVRHVAWNGGIALSAVYFLNGLAVLVGVLGMLGPRALIPLALILMFLAYVQAYPTLCFVGLFDTWGEFRERFGRMLARAREHRESDGEG